MALQGKAICERSVDFCSLYFGLVCSSKCVVFLAKRCFFLSFIAFPFPLFSAGNGKKPIIEMGPHSKLKRR